MLSIGELMNVAYLINRQEPVLDFLAGQQDERGLPEWWCEQEEERLSTHHTCCTAIYDYDSIPDVVVTNGESDWPLELRNFNL